MWAREVEEAARLQTERQAELDALQKEREALEREREAVRLEAKLTQDLTRAKLRPWEGDMYRFAAMGPLINSRTVDCRRLWSWKLARS